MACSVILTRECRRASCPCGPIVFFVGNAEHPGVQPELVKSQEDADSGVTVATQKTKRMCNRRPYAVIGGLMRGQSRVAEAMGHICLTWESSWQLHRVPRCGLECGSRPGWCPTKLDINALSDAAPASR